MSDGETGVVHNTTMTTTTNPDDRSTRAGRARSAPVSAGGSGTSGAAPARYSTRLNADWARLIRRPRSLAQVRTWDLSPFIDREALAAAGPEIFDHLLRLATDEDCLRQLLGLAQNDDLAARLVIQRLIPLLLASSRTYRDPHRFDDLIAAAWIVVRTFDQRRQPSCLSAALARSAQHLAYKAAARRRSATERVSSPDQFVHIAGEEPAVDPAGELAEVLQLARTSGVEAADLQFIRALVASGSTTVLAARLGVTSRTVRNHRRTIVYRIRRAVMAG